ncbi:hypothetical protein BDZ90DRAFT_159451 [Jaminaea rosea]|uniref:Autophagy-related protein 2 n=1 Tax=Jaminaea rosea TaxID=1569628 RepID=A0A316USM4_9BASI|nr:hypothetical protein BDZ90DRAFT_159451 [Jaminaea rosea]PWN27994.1 hypothetical protein BDZ90DRAFT_159451 [Jaminaea rosea]
MFALPTFLGGWELPTLSSYTSLSSTLQKRIFSFVLRRLLGRYVKEGQLDWNQIEAGITRGSLEISNVELDPAAINQPLDGTPLRASGLVVGSISMQLPLTNLRSGGISITVKEPRLRLELAPTVASRQRPGPSSQSPLDAPESLADLAESLLHDDVEGRQLEQSIQDSMLSEDDTAIPGSVASGPEAQDAPQAGGFVAAIIEGLLARLSVSIQRPSIVLEHTPATSQLGKVTLDLTADNIELQSETSEEAAGVDDALPVRSKMRKLEVSGLALWCTCSPTETGKKPRPPSSGSGSGSSEDDDDEDSEGMMQMSQAVQDLSLSTASAVSHYSDATAGSASVYESAELPAARGEEAVRHRILSFGEEPIIVRMTTQRPVCTVRGTGAASNATAREPIVRNIDLSIEAGTLAGLVRPQDACGILSLVNELNCLMEGQGQHRDGTAAPRSTQPSTVALSAKVSLKAAHLLCAYGMVEADSNRQTGLDAFWARPSRTQPPLDHLRLNLSSLLVSFTQQAGLESKSNLALRIADTDLMDHHLSTKSSSTMVTLPILIFEPSLGEEAPSSLLDWVQLARESAFSTNKSSFQPYTRTTFGERAWRLKPRHRRGSSKTAETTESGAESPKHSLAVDGTFSTSEQLSYSVHLGAMQFFADLSMVSRIMPLLHSLGSVHSARSPPPSSMGGSSLMSSIETLHAERIADDDVQAKSPVALTLNCELIRTHVRVPNKHGREQDGHNDATSLRSGLLAVDIADVGFVQGAPSGVAATPPPTGLRVRYAEDTRPAEPSAEVSVGHIAVHFQSSVAGATVSTIANVGQLGRQDEESTPRLRPRIQLPDATSSIRSITRAFVPLCTASISKPTLDGLALMADDATAWSADLSRIGESSQDEQDGLRILGSRFFGSRVGLASPSMSSDSINTVQDAGQKKGAFELNMTEAEVTLLVPRQSARSAGQEASPRQLDVIGRDMRLFFDPSHEKDTASLTLTLLALFIKQRDASLPLLTPTMEQSLTRGVTPVLSLSMVLFADSASSRRESRIEPLVRDLTVSVTEDLSLFADLGAFFQSPAGAFENVEPNELTRLMVRLKNVSLQLAPATTPARAVLLLGDMQLRSRLVGDSPRSSYTFAFAETIVLVVDEANPSVEERRFRIKRPLDHWVAQGFAKVLRVDDIQGSVTMSRLTLPDVDVKVSRVRAELSACADTALAFEPLAAAFSAGQASQGMASDAEEATGDTSMDSFDDGDDAERGTGSANILDSLDEDAFRGKVLPSAASIPDMLDDDIPSHPAYYGHEPRQPTVYVETPLAEDEFFGAESIASMVETEAASETASGRGGERSQAPVLFSSNIVTIRSLDPRGIRPTPGYFSRSDLTPASRNPSANLASTLRIRVSDCDITLKLHGGYDWSSTRIAIEDEIKRVRRRLQKIKQLLDEGQQPDDSIEEATQGLMESIHISAPFDPRGAEVGQALGALNAELEEEQSETASSTSTWQPLPRGQQRSAAGSGAFAATTAAVAARRKRSKLERSHSSQIDIAFRGFALEYDVFTSGSPLTSNLDASAASVQILDNLKTSTWHAFLTEMKSNKHLPEASRRGAKMLRVQVLGMPTRRGRRRGGEGGGEQASSNPSEVELRVRAKLSPLRLHVDQDALDFLKKFFAFERRGTVPPNSSPRRSPSGSALPYIQYAEILPITLCLDYKPKRVDYSLLLRQGKAIEMMNFFHFDAAEMTLRHIKLRGIAGWPRLFDTLNDIWTPDVKANQLADVLAGIAPLRSVVNVGAGVADLVLLPIEQYQKDGRLGKGLQKGAKRFAKATALEAFRLGAKLATGTQVVLERAEHVLGGRIQGVAESGPATRREKRRDNRGSDRGSSDEEDDDYEDGLVSTIIDPSATNSSASTSAQPLSKYASPPASMGQALSQAYTGLQRGVSSAAQTILAVPMEVYESGQPGSPGGGGAGGSGGRTVVRAVPIAVLQGARGASEAVSRTMMGLAGVLEGGQPSQARSDSQRIKESGGMSSRIDETSRRGGDDPRAMAGKYKQRQS